MMIFQKLLSEINLPMKADFVRLTLSGQLVRLLLRVKLRLIGLLGW